MSFFFFLEPLEDLTFLPQTLVNFATHQLPTNSKSPRRWTDPLHVFFNNCGQQETEEQKCSQDKVNSTNTNNQSEGQLLRLWVENEKILMGSKPL